MTAARYWNHNTAYHPWILGHVAQFHDPIALDVGAGDGLLMEQLAPICAQVIGIEPDEDVATRVRERLKATPNVRLLAVGLDGLDLEPESVDVITVVASLHHMASAAALTKAAGLLRPGGKLLVVGLAAHATLADWLYAAAVWPVARIGSWMHNETSDIGVPTKPPSESLNDIRIIASQVLPGVQIRRGLYYRYLLSWTKP